MFTGIIDQLGKISAIAPLANGPEKGVSLSIHSGYRSVRVGESIAVNGVCLTVTKKKIAERGTVFSMEISEETLKKTSFYNARGGDEVNLERALNLQSRIGGHFVQGHVDATGKILTIISQGNSELFSFSYPAFLRPFLVAKGSVAVDGISLTIVEVTDDSFTVSILPFTKRSTTLKNRKIGDAVHIEADYLAKIVAKQIREFSRPSSSRDDLYQKQNLEWDILMKEEGYL